MSERGWVIAVTSCAVGSPRIVCGRCGGALCGVAGCVERYRVRTNFEVLALFAVVLVLAEHEGAGNGHATFESVCFLGQEFGFPLPNGEVHPQRGPGVFPFLRVAVSAAGCVSQPAAQDGFTGLRVPQLQRLSEVAGDRDFVAQLFTSFCLFWPAQMPHSSPFDASAQRCWTGHRVQMCCANSCSWRLWEYHSSGSCPTHAASTVQGAGMNGDFMLLPFAVLGRGTSADRRASGRRLSAKSRGRARSGRNEC